LRTSLQVTAATSFVLIFFCASMAAAQFAIMGQLPVLTGKRILPPTAGIGLDRHAHKKAEAFYCALPRELGNSVFVTCSADSDIEGK
jgi:hypothetical protein